MATACIGKWHLGWDWDAIRKPDTPKKSLQPEHFDWSKPIPDGPLDHGFDHYFGDTVINFPPYAWIVDDRLPRAPDTFITGRFEEAPKEGNWEVRAGPALSDWDFYEVLPELTRKSAEWVRSRKGKEAPENWNKRYGIPEDDGLPVELYNLREDIGQKNDLAAEQPERVAAMQAQLKQVRESKYSGLNR